jgi:tetratricopeptide (TPR) repeat protein
MRKSLNPRRTWAIKNHQKSPEWAGVLSEQISNRDYLRGCHLSKLSILKQEAYQAGKKRDWGRAVSVYEQILELDKNNPTVINELGDLCLKLGETSQGVKHFLGAAAKYRQSGLLNNAVAIYKKILRYEDDNQNAHWYLAESRASQGLMVEGEQHGLAFLSNHESLSGDIKEIFLKRCVKLFELYPESAAIQDNLLQVFRMWSMPQEAGRSQIQLACLQWEKGENETAVQAVAEALAQSPELSNYPEHARWLELQGTPAQPDIGQNFDSVALDDPFEAPEVSTPPVQEIPDPFEAPEVPVEEAAPVAEEISPQPASFGDVDFGAPEPTEETFGLAPRTEEAKPVVEEVVPEKEDEPDDNGCFNLDMGGDSSFDDLIAQASEGIAKKPDEIEEFPELENDQPDETSFADETPQSVNLLDELLAEDPGENWSSPDGELKTISEEIGAQVGGDSGDESPASLYEMGMVYLEMDLHDQAADSFQKASCHPEFAVRAYEMWGITLQRANKCDEAIAVLTDGLDVPDEGSREYLGLLYHIARAHEQGDNNDEALRLFEMIQKQDPGFLDVGRRLSKLIQQP